MFATSLGETMGAKSLGRTMCQQSLGRSMGQKNYLVVHIDELQMWSLNFVNKNFTETQTLDNNKNIKLQPHLESGRSHRHVITKFNIQNLCQTRTHSVTNTHTHKHKTTLDNSPTNQGPETTRSWKPWSWDGRNKNQLQQQAKFGNSIQTWTGQNNQSATRNEVIQISQPKHNN